MIFVTVYHDACNENLLLHLILFTFRIKRKAPLRQMSDFTLSHPILAAILCNAPRLVFQPPPPPPDNYCTIPNKLRERALPLAVSISRFSPWGLRFSPRGLRFSPWGLRS